MFKKDEIDKKLFGTHNYEEFFSIHQQVVVGSVFGMMLFECLNVVIVCFFFQS